MDKVSKNILKKITNKRCEEGKIKEVADKYQQVQNFIADKNLDTNDWKNILAAVQIDCTKLIK